MLPRAINKSYVHGLTDPITKKPKIMVLNCGSRLQAGGRVEAGACGREESLAVRTTMVSTLEAGDLHKSVAGDEITPNLADDDLIYSPKVRVMYLDPDLRLSRDEEFDISILTMPALDWPQVHDGVLATKEDVVLMQDKIESILHHAAQNRVEYLILSAFGCGASGNPPQEIAEMFSEAIFGHDDWPWSRTGLQKIIFRYCRYQR